MKAINFNTYATIELTVYSIEYYGAYVEMADEHVLKSEYDKLKKDNDELKIELKCNYSNLLLRVINFDNP